MVSRLIANSGKRSPRCQLWSGLVSRAGAPHRVNKVYICRKVLPTKDVPNIFTDFCFISPNYGLACSRLLEGYKVPLPPCIPSRLCGLLLDYTLERKCLKRVTLTEATMAEMSTSDCLEKFLECCYIYNKHVNLCLRGLRGLKEAP